MVTSPAIEVADLIHEGPMDFRVRGRIYTDPAIFDVEMERIFGRCWVYIAHESEVAQGGDYKTACIGRQPVIVTRDPDDGQIYVLYNRCSHRGATVCQNQYGNSTYFRCAYHSWTFNNRGELVGVPFPQGYGKAFNLRGLGLTRVPRVDSYRGFIFASLSPAGPSLGEHLGNARTYIDHFVDMGPEGLALARGVQRVAYAGNWKFQLENTVDGYHFTSTHQSYAELTAKRAGLSRPPVPSPGRRTLDLGNGHAVLEVEQGRPGAMYSPGFNLVVFPNLALLFSQVRVIRPIAVDRTEVSLYPVLLKGVPPEVNTKRLREHEDFYGPASFASPDDVEMFVRCQRGLQATGDDWVVLSRGLHAEMVDERGIRSSSSMDESSQRALYRQWSRLMAVGQTLVGR